MSGHIFNIQDDGRLVEMNEEPFANEGVFQELLEKYPNLLAGDQIDSVAPRRWLLIKREMGIPGEEAGGERWSLDHLFLDQDGIPTLVEVKRSSDTRIRREVVGQMLDYAANAVLYWPFEELRAKYAEACQAQGIDPEERLLRFLGEDGDSEKFWQQVKTNLQAKKIRLLFVADVIPRELRRIVEFLNEIADPTEILAIEIRHYVGQDMKTLVPRVIGQTAEAEKRKGVSGRRSDETRSDFWTAFYEQATKQALRPSPGTPSGETAITFLTNDPDLHLDGRADRKMGRLSLTLRLEGTQAQARWELLQKHLEHAGDSLTKPWKCGHGKKKRGFVMSASTDCSLDAKEQWPRQHQWLMEAVRELHDVLLPLISQVK